MERRKEETLSNVLLRFLRMQGLETPLAEHRLLQSWETVVGRMVAAKSRDLFVKGQCLHVTLSSPVLRSELTMRKTELVRLLNEKAEANVINDIAFHRGIHAEKAQKPRSMNAHFVWNTNHAD